MAVVSRPQTENEGHGPSGPFGGFWIVGSAASKTALEHFGMNDPGVERDGRQTCGKFLCEGLSESLDRPFGCAVGGDLGTG